MVNEEEIKEEAPSKEKLIFTKFADMIKKDQQLMKNADQNGQHPLSQAYISTCSFTKTKAGTLEEEKQMVQGYHVDKEKRLQAMDATAQLRELSRKNLITDGGLP